VRAAIADSLYLGRSVQDVPIRRYARKRPLRSGSLEARLKDLLLLAIPGEFAAKFSSLELYRLVTSIVRLICGRSLRLSAGDSML
jgi:hypothetical protein